MFSDSGMAIADPETHPETLIDGSKGPLEVPVGLIIPPPDIREIIEKTADYVHRNGSSFEARIRENERKNTRFNFLNPSDPYFPYYEWRLDENREGRGGLMHGSSETKPSAEEPEEIGPKEPPPLEFAITMPRIAALDLDILRQTALFVARNGRSFASLLAQREERNYQFDFLRPNHSLYQYYMKLVDQYVKVLSPPKDLKERLEDNIKNKYIVLERAQQRADWKKYQEAETQKAAEEAEAEKIAFAQIDWHDFIVVETIEFTHADKEVELPPPMSLSELEHASLEQKQLLSLFNASKLLAIEEAPPTADDVEVETITEVAESPAAPPSNLRFDEDEERIKERQEALRRQRQAQADAQAPASKQNMKIRAAGSTRLVSKRETKEIMQECPRCHMLIPASEYSEHIRIELLDPRWKEERAKAEARYSMSNLTTSEVATNIKRLASARSDLFDSEGNALTPEEANRQKKR
ncbi:Pre-mRNA splicing factor PRP21 like protein-domain-containing protein [Dipodascopsis uninucleata]